MRGNQTHGTAPPRKREVNRMRSLDSSVTHHTTNLETPMSSTFTISEKALATLPGNSLHLTKVEAEQVAQVFGLRVLDWRRLSDQAAGNWMGAVMQKHGADSFIAALTRVRRLAGRERGFWLTSIAVVDPKLAPLLKSPPDWTDAQVWIVTFGVFMLDEMRKVLQQLEVSRMEAALAEHV